MIKELLSRAKKNHLSSSGEIALAGLLKGKWCLQATFEAVKEGQISVAGLSKRLTGKPDFGGGIQRQSEGDVADCSLIHHETHCWSPDSGLPAGQRS